MAATFEIPEPLFERLARMAARRGQTTEELVTEILLDGAEAEGNRMVLVESMLTGKDRQRLRRRSAMTDPSHRVWRSFDGDAAANAIAALRILVG